VDVLARRRRSVALRRVTRRSVSVARWGPLALPVLILLGCAAATGAVIWWPGVMPWSVFIPFTVIAGLFLPPRLMVPTYLGVFAMLAAAGVQLADSKSAFVGNAVVAVLVGAAMMWLGFSRARLGVQGTLGESMLVDLRDRLRAHGELPDLPEPWQAEASLHSAYGQSYSGDFLVANRSNQGDRLEVALVDVSGKGVDAGTRALLLSGAFGGLLGAMDPAQFLPAANAYLLRQNWNEGFATAIHVSLDLTTGQFCLGGAGHPPGVKFSAGSGLWEVLDERGGPLLGVMEGVEFPRTVGRLDRGDALLLYTDGVIETRTRDLNAGIDRMLGAAERLVSQGFRGGAARISSAAAAGETDDRAVVLIWRH